jgi:hypothetical protein
MADSGARRAPFLAQPFEAGVTGWIVIIGAILAEIIGGTVTYRMSTSVALPVLVIPAALALGFAAVQWWQVRSSGAEPANWWHFAGIAAGVLSWVLWPTMPGVLDGTGSASAACNAMGESLTPGCLGRAAQALDKHNIVWWGTLVLIALLALLVRRSRIAAWAAVPVAFAGCLLATHYLEQLLVYYNAGG